MVRVSWRGEGGGVGEEDREVLEKAVAGRRPEARAGVTEKAELGRKVAKGDEPRVTQWRSEYCVRREGSSGAACTAYGVRRCSGVERAACGILGEIVVRRKNCVWTAEI